MPVKPAAIWRQSSILSAPQLEHAENDPDRGEECAKQRGPDHGLAPQLLLSTQRFEVEEMRDRAEPVPEPLRLRGPHHDLARGAGHIDRRLVRVVELEAMQRPVALGTADGEL